VRRVRRRGAFVRLARGRCAALDGSRSAPRFSLHPHIEVYLVHALTYDMVEDVVNKNADRLREWVATLVEAVRSTVSTSTARAFQRFPPEYDVNKDTQSPFDQEEDLPFARRLPFTDDMRAGGLGGLTVDYNGKPYDPPTEQRRCLGMRPYVPPKAWDPDGHLAGLPDDADEYAVPLTGATCSKLPKYREFPPVWLGPLDVATAVPDAEGPMDVDQDDERDREPELDAQDQEVLADVRAVADDPMDDDADPDAGGPMEEVERDEREPDPDPEADEPMEEGEAQHPELLAGIREVLAQAQAVRDHADQAQGSEEQVYVVCEVEPDRFGKIRGGEVPKDITEDELHWTMVFLNDAGDCKVYSHIHECGFSCYKARANGGRTARPGMSPHQGAKVPSGSATAYRGHRAERGEENAAGGP